MYIGVIERLGKESRNPINDSVQGDHEIGTLVVELNDRSLVLFDPDEHNCISGVTRSVIVDGEGISMNRNLVTWDRVGARSVLAGEVYFDGEKVDFHSGMIGSVCGIIHNEEYQVLDLNNTLNPLFEIIGPFHIDGMAKFKIIPDLICQG